MNFQKLSGAAYYTTGAATGAASVESLSKKYFGVDLAYVEFPRMLYRVESAVFGAAFVWCALYLLSSTAPPSNNVSYGITILGLTSFVTAMTAQRIEKAYSTYKYNLKMTKDENEAKDKLIAMKTELEVSLDLIRFAGTMITGPLAFFALYNMLPLGVGDILQGRGVIVMLFVFGMLAFTLSKLLVYETPKKEDNLTVQIVNVILLLGGGALILIVFIDLLTSAKNSPIESNILFFCLVALIGYSIVYLFVQIWRVTETDHRAEWIDTGKHVLLVLLDVLVVGFLVYGSLMDAYQRPFTNTRFFLTTPEITLSPPPPMPPLPMPPSPTS